MLYIYILVRCQLALLFTPYQPHADRRPDIDLIKLALGTCTGLIVVLLIVVTFLIVVLLKKRKNNMKREGNIIQDDITYTDESTTM